MGSTRGGGPAPPPPPPPPPAGGAEGGAGPEGVHRRETVEHLAQWYGPNGFTITTYEHDCRVGGRWRFMMHGPDGKDWPNRIEYREVVRPERLVYDHGSDVDDDPDQFHVTISFDDEGGRTRLTSRMVFRTSEQRDVKTSFGAVELGNQTLARLAEHLKTMQPG